MVVPAGARWPMDVLLYHGELYVYPPIPPIDITLSPQARTDHYEDYINQ